MMGTEFKDGELIVENGSIMSVGSAGSDFFDGEVLDLTGYLVMPGFINAHCHLSLSALFNKVDKIEIFSDWVLALLEQDEAMNDGQRIKAIHQEANSLVDSGVTTLADYLGRPNLLR